MYDLDKAYPSKFFTQRRSLEWRVPIIVDAIMHVLNPQSVIDVGCGNADLLERFSLKIKSPCYGIEGTTNALAAIRAPMNNYVFLRDLRAPLEPSFLLRRVDLAVCFEVAEHIELEYSDIFVDNLCSLSDHILMSAAHPGQGGKCHVNCQPQAYWFYKFESRGYRRNHQVEDDLKAQWAAWRHKKGIKAYYENLMYWEKI
jgi:hypothetical protein